MASSPQRHRAALAAAIVIGATVLGAVALAATSDNAPDAAAARSVAPDPSVAQDTSPPPVTPSVTTSSPPAAAEPPVVSAPQAPEHLIDVTPRHLDQPLDGPFGPFASLEGAAAIGYPTTTTTTTVAPRPTTPPSPPPASGGPNTTQPPNDTPPPATTLPAGGSTVALGLGASNTGVVGGQNSGNCSSALRPLSGNLVIDDAWLETENGGSRTVEEFDLSGSILVQADNVTFRCARVSGGAAYSVDNKATGTKFEWFEAGQDNDGKTILGGNYTAYRCNVHGGEDSIHINTGTVTITECYIHDQNFIGGDPHPDAIQVTSAGSVQRVTVVRSKLISFYKAPNAALQINVVDSWSITDSYLWGGVYSILGDPGNPGTVTNNFFGWDSSQSGAIGGVNTTRSGNVWWEWVSPRCSGIYSASSCNTPGDHPGNGTPI